MQFADSAVVQDHDSRPGSAHTTLERKPSTRRHRIPSVGEYARRADEPGHSYPYNGAARWACSPAEAAHQG
jgi:hypothetical protein